MTPREVIKLALVPEELSRVKLEYAIKSVDDEERTVTGEVYAPFIIDTHGEMMLPEDVKKLAYRFLANKLQDQIDVMHDGTMIDAYAVESFIARPNDPDYTEGAWVLTTKIDDDPAWADAKAGKLNGYSLEAMVFKVDAEVEISMVDQCFGLTEEKDGHDHAFFVTLDDNGRVIGGHTSEDEGHYHVIKAGTATATSVYKNGSGLSDHTHRFFLP